MKSLILYLIGGFIVVSLSSCNKNKNTPPQHINIREKLAEADKGLRPLPYKIGIDIARKLVFK